MDPADEEGSDLIERSGRLLKLTGALNLEDLDDKSRHVICRTLSAYPFVEDFWWLRSHLLERRRLVCVYGVDNLSDDSLLFGKMRVLTAQLFSHAQAQAAYCALRSQLCLEQNDFFDELLSRVDGRLGSCDSEELEERLMQVICRLKDVYNVYLC